ncbi:MAG: hypothetical protein KJ607_04475 [Bacteroidetes bacterium]|nr:hypothetical protein [Bacteroidota bacterium]
MYIIKVLLLTIGIILCQSLYGQKLRSSLTDSSSVHNPKLASAFSAVVPGLGQVYNRKFWKPPVIYACFGALGLGFHYYEKMYVGFRHAYNTRIDGDPLTIDEYEEIYSTETLKSLREESRRYRDLCFIGTFLIYVLNIVDAAVDAHLYDYNITDDLSVRLSPVLYNNYGQPALGIRCNLMLKNTSTHEIYR